MAGQKKVKCTALYKNDKNVNVQVTVGKTLRLIRLLTRAVEEALQDKSGRTGVRLYNIGKDKEDLYVGVAGLRKGPRRKAA